MKRFRLVVIYKTSITFLARDIIYGDIGDATPHLRRRHPYFACTLSQQEWLSRDHEYLQTAKGQLPPLTVPLMDIPPDPFNASESFRQLNHWDQVRAVPVDGRLYQTRHYLVIHLSFTIIR